MGHAEKRCILWVGDKHSGKTTAATKLAETLQQQGCTVGGILAPSIYKDDRLIGFDIFDIQNNLRIPLAVRDEQPHDDLPYRYHQEGLELGHSALSLAENKSANLVIVDEYGPLELNGKGWRCDVDHLLSKSHLPILLVVRRQVVDKVNKLYAEYISLSLDALDPGSIERVLTLLKK